ncbi:MAG: hypothetical protein U5J64_12560 [Halobacteriales archaeon]|nr:hypothetical protein [Halobacteriales archaeon]
MSQLKQKGECPECGKAYEEPPSGTVRMVCVDCEIIFDGEGCRSLDEVVEKAQRRSFGQ